MPLSLSGSFRTANAWAVAVAAGVLLAVGLAAAPIAAADLCDNSGVRVQTGSAALPDCRAFEMVSPPYKEGFPAEAPVFTDEGIVSYRSAGSFAGNTNGVLLGMGYSAVRSEAGWATTAPGPPEAIYDTRTTGRQGESADLRRSLWLMSRRDVPDDPFGFWVRGPDGAVTRIGDADILGDVSGDPQFVGTQTVFVEVSDDLSHVVFNYGFSGNAKVTALREYVGTGNEGLPRVVTVDNGGQPSPLEACPKGMSGDGRVIVYSLVTKDGCSNDARQQLWARVAGSATVAVSGSECTRTADDLGGLCNGVSAAAFAGMADDGSRVFFTTGQQLVNGDTNAGNDLYACDIPAGVPAPVGSANACAALTQVSGTAANAQVENVVAVSEDGARVFFVAQGALASNVGVGDVGPATGAGAHNLYVWERDGVHPGGQTQFVARVPSNDLLGVGSPSQMTPSGRYLVFTTVDGLVAGDDDGARDVYRYDAGTETMARVSASVAGGGGNNSAFDASISRQAAITSDGSTVIFGTAEALSQSDTNGAADVYSWRDGQVSLITPGGGVPAGITPSGRDIFFMTNAPLLAADGDLIGDIYTARVGGGFDPPRPPAPCSGDGCQGLLSGVPGLAGPRSGPSGDGDAGDAAVVLSLRAVTATQRRRLAATGKLALTVKANRAGRVTATARAKIGRRSVAVGSARRTMTTPGSVAVTLKLSRRARAQLTERGRLTVMVSVSHSKASRGRSVTLKLTRTGASRSSVGGRS